MIDEELGTEEDLVVETLLDVIELKSGKHTTELLMLILNTVGMLILSLGVITTEQAEPLKIIVLLIYLVVLYLTKVYMDWRGQLKIKTIEANTQMQSSTIINN